MGRVLANNITLSYSVETALGEPSTDWVMLQPNSIGTFGAEITSVSREPIDKNRQREKGVLTDLNSNMEFEHDLTLSVFTDFIEGLCFATSTNRDLDLSAVSVDGTTHEFNVTALNTAQANRLNFSAGEFATLIHARGFVNSGNNGLFALDADVADGAADVGVASTLTEEASAPSNAQIELAGTRFLDGVTDVTVTYSGGYCWFYVGCARRIPWTIYSYWIARWHRGYSKRPAKHHRQ
jgi:hypothetical protein